MDVLQGENIPSDAFQGKIILMENNPFDVLLSEETYPLIQDTYRATMIDAICLRDCDTKTTMYAIQGKR